MHTVQTYLGVAIFPCGIPFLTLFAPLAYRMFTSARTLIVLFGATTAIALIGCGLFLSGDINFGVAFSLGSPLLQLAIAVPLFRAFGRWLGRPPEDVVYNFKKGLLWDRLLAGSMVSLIWASAVISNWKPT
jgi:hypothetical protein